MHTFIPTEEVAKRCGDKLYRTALAIMKNKSDAEDVVQDVFVKRMEKAPDFASDAHELAWLMRVTVNLCKSKLRSSWRRKTEPLLESYPAQNQEQESVVEQVMALPLRYRTVIHLFYYEGYSCAEIAGITAQKEAAVRQQLTRARGMLREALEGEDL
ncbi:MAG: sigma-70 family RNA polymerase sigma factor [Oscillospiraceae bacterium]|nr:sigma-70 family RNA polymerase sigma factor [Oscillospiraceae bacterium]